ncbi:WASH complex subunit 5-like [Tribolium madens]|nr:WASH complex subunit 5-like [Tribolium madens]
MSTLSHYFDYSGLNNPFNKIYITSKFDNNHYITIFVFVIAHLHKVFFPRNKRNTDQIDGTTFAVSIHTLIKQFHNKLNESFINLLSDYITQLTRYNISVKSTDLPLEVSLAMSFLETFTNYSEASRKCLKEAIPDEILHLQQTLIASSS